jgi:hypothetical protein
MTAWPRPRSAALVLLGPPLDRLHRLDAGVALAAAHGSRWKVGPLRHADGNRWVACALQTPRDRAVGMALQVLQVEEFQGDAWL